MLQYPNIRYLVAPVLILILLFIFRDSSWAPPGLGRPHSNALSYNSYLSIQDTHHEIFSVSTRDKKFFQIDFGDQKGINPNIIPHPVFNDTWIVVAQLHKKLEVPNSVWFAELTCNAVFKNGVLSCLRSPAILPIAATEGDKCNDHFGMSVGPHDARVFHGPKAPYAIYGSVSQYTCFGQWIQDFRLLVDWGFEMFERGKFRHATEIQRPAPYGVVEKNYFLFWDKDDKIYAHYDIWPKRVFSKLENDGSIGLNLAPAATSDERCLAMYMPEVAPPPTQESIHQATNSLSITLCKRSDPSCKANDSNTFLFTMFQHKVFKKLHSVYEPYVMVFKQQAPFEIHGISSRPIWIHGRGLPGQGMRPEFISDAEFKVWDQTEMFYITSISWKTQGMRYHGYIDDVLFVGFGIEDRDTGGIDVLAGDLLGDLALCNTT